MIVNGYVLINMKQRKPSSAFGWIIREIQITGFTVWILQMLFDMKPYLEKHNQMRSMQPNTVGRAVAELLDQNNFKLIPKFENHDLKHLILGYNMTIEDEVRMQAFLVGNGNYTIPCLIFLSLGLFMPELWKELIVEYKKGERTKSIYYLTLDNSMNRSIYELQKEYRLF